MDTHICVVQVEVNNNRWQIKGSNSLAVNPPTARHVATKTPADDEDEYEDSFINDDSEDAGDDSDYVPPDSDDSGKEDIKGLQRDATAFLKRRK